jgi:2-dehydropantoate 2-reductase
MQIAIIGLGGVGGYFGFKLAQAFKHQEDITFTFVARNPTYQIVRQNGLSLISPENLGETSVKPDILLEHVKDIKSADLVLICVKEYDLENICRGLKPIVKDNTVILPLMNGVDIYERIRTVIGDGIVLPSCVYIASHIKEKGVILHQGKPQSPFLPDAVIPLFIQAGISIEYQENVYPAIWEKFIFIASFGLVSGRYNKSIGEILESTELKQKAKSIMEEIRNIAIGKLIRIHPNIIDLTFKKAENFPYNTPTSLQLDLQSKKSNTELKLFTAPILRFGKELNLPVHSTKEVYSEIMQRL